MTMIVALLAAATLSAGPGPAAPAAAMPATTGTAALAALPAAKPAASRYAIRYDQKRDRYCLTERGAVPLTGTRLVPETCKSSDAWAADGLTITRKP